MKAVPIDSPEVQQQSQSNDNGNFMEIDNSPPRLVELGSESPKADSGMIKVVNEHIVSTSSVQLCCNLK